MLRLSSRRSSRMDVLTLQGREEAFVLRDYRESDADNVNRVAHAAFAEFKESYCDWPTMVRNVSRMAALARDGELVVAECAGEIRGAVVYIPPGRPRADFFEREWPIIRMLVVEPAGRGRGLGRALTEACLARAERDGADAIALHTSPIMTVALAMYLRLGFTLARDAPAVLGVPYAVYLKSLGS